ncbi:MAG TPA: hypothetical protein VL624_06280 [Caldimonas sp.]|jgi:hypothetical protein|nr:hypothetical protein [Caldimonas sp.]
MHRWTGPMRPRGASIAVVAALAAGCASAPQLDAQWSDPAAAPGLLRGARVLVACDAAELVVRQICQDRLAGEVAARGATPVFVPPETPIVTDRSIDSQLLAPARESGAKALLVMTVAVAVHDVSAPVQIGIGGFGFGSSSSVGVGVSAPVGGGRVTAGYSGNGRVTDVSNGRLVWTAKATSPPSADLDAQMADLSRLVLGAADKAGLF